MDTPLISMPHIFRVKRPFGGAGHWGRYIVCPIIDSVDLIDAPFQKMSTNQPNIRSEQMAYRTNASAVSSTMLLTSMPRS